jgi:hypothetical protein
VFTHEMKKPQSPNSTLLPALFFWMRLEKMTTEGARIPVHISLSHSLFKSTSCLLEFITLSWEKGANKWRLTFFFFLEWLAPPSLRLSLMITFPICYQPSENLPVPSSLFSCNRMEVLKCRSRYAFSNFTLAFTLAFTLGRNLPTVFRHPHLSS